MEFVTFTGAIDKDKADKLLDKIDETALQNSINRKRFQYWVNCHVVVYIAYSPSKQIVSSMELFDKTSFKSIGYIDF